MSREFPTRLNLLILSALCTFVCEQSEVNAYESLAEQRGQELLANEAVPSQKKSQTLRKIPEARTEEASESTISSEAAQEKARQFNKEGAALLTQKKPAEAAEMFRKAIQISPEGAAAHNNLALVLKDMGNFVEAEKEARIACKLRADKANYQFNLGLILQHQTKWSEAESCFRATQKVEPMDAENLFRLSQVLLQESRPEEAETEIKMAILLKPSESGYHKVLADCYLQEKKYDSALCEYRSTLELNPTGAEAGDVKNKIEYLRQVLNSK